MWSYMGDDVTRATQNVQIWVIPSFLFRPAGFLYLSLLLAPDLRFSIQGIISNHTIYVNQLGLDWTGPF